MESRVARWEGTTFRVAAEPLRAVGPGEVQVRVGACAVCVTEVHLLDELFVTPAPEVLGHEFAGVVTAAGPRTDGFPIGTLVASAGAFGGFSDQVVAEVSRLVALPADTPLESACLVEPLSCCIQAVERAAVPSGATVLVTGAGTNGILIVQLLRRSGAARVIVSEPDPARARRALELGASRVLDPRAAPLSEQLRDVPVDVVVETSGSLHAVRDGLAVVARGGRVVLFAVYPEAVSLDLAIFDFQLRDVALVSSFGYTRDDVLSAVRWLPELDLDRLITYRAPLEDIDSAFEAARTASGLKALVLPAR